MVPRPLRVSVTADWADGLRSLIQQLPSVSIRRRLLHVWEESDGLLWTYSVIPDERWRPGVRPDAWDIGWATETRDTKIEVLDLNGGGRVLAEKRVDEPLMPVCGSGLMTKVRETPAGDTRTVVLRPRLAVASEYRGSPSR